VSVSAAAPLGVYVIVLPVYDVNFPPPPLIVIVFLSAERVYDMGTEHVAPGYLKNVSAVGWNVICVVGPLYVLPLTHSNPVHFQVFVYPVGLGKGLEHVFSLHCRDEEYSKKLHRVSALHRALHASTVLSNVVEYVESGNPELYM
jgi:hypothetical protein